MCIGQGKRRVRTGCDTHLPKLASLSFYTEGGNEVHRCVEGSLLLFPAETSQIEVRRQNQRACLSPWAWRRPRNPPFLGSLESVTYKVLSLGWRVKSVVKSIYCSWRRQWFDSKTHSMELATIWNSSPRESEGLFWSLKALGMDAVHMQAKH